MGDARLQPSLQQAQAGGLVSAAITEIPGCSDVFEAGYVTYSNAAKIEDLHVSQDVVETFGAVSVATAWAMARGALQASEASATVEVRVSCDARRCELVVRDRGIGFERRDYPVLQVLIMMAALIYIVVNLLVDIAYAVIDPRVRAK